MSSPPNPDPLLARLGELMASTQGRVRIELAGTRVDVRVAEEAGAPGAVPLDILIERTQGSIEVTMGGWVQRIPAGAWHRLDRYEGEFYRRESVAVRPIDGDHDVNAWSYVFRPRFRSRLSQCDWHYDIEAKAYAKAQLVALLAPEPTQ